jgi:hypothetical protein
MKNTQMMLTQVTKVPGPDDKYVVYYVGEFKHVSAYYVNQVPTPTTGSLGLELTPAVRRLIFMVLNADAGWTINMGEPTHPLRDYEVILSDSHKEILRRDDDSNPIMCDDIILYRLKSWRPAIDRVKVGDNVVCRNKQRPLNTCNHCTFIYSPDVDQCPNCLYFNEPDIAGPSDCEKEAITRRIAEEQQDTVIALGKFDLETIIDHLIARTSSFPAPSPYHRKITRRALLNGCFMDSYDIDTMWPLPGNLSPLQHALKKSLAPGNRGEGHKSIHKDLKEIAWSTAEAVETFKE